MLLINTSVSSDRTGHRLFEVVPMDSSRHAANRSPWHTERPRLAPPVPEITQMALGRQVLLTAEGQAALIAEMRELIDTKRPEIVERVATARAEGDLRENFAYHDARRELGLLDGRVQTIEGMLRHALIVEAAPYDGTVVLGATVVVRDDFGDSEYTIVVPAEADIARQRISLDSPLGAAISGHRAGDEVSVDSPGGIHRVAVVHVR
jgi:transcription elongation factor GreA